MFGSRKDAERRLAELNAKFETLEERNLQLIAAAEAMNKRAFLFGIERDGRINKFLFVRNGKIFAIETMGMLGDDVPGWKRDLLE